MGTMRRVSRISASGVSTTPHSSAGGASVVWWWRLAAQVTQRIDEATVGGCADDDRREEQTATRPSCSDGGFVRYSRTTVLFAPGKGQKTAGEE